MGRLSKRSLLGELIIDHSASPGTPDVPGGTVLEVPVLTCCHCQKTVILRPDRQRPRNWCQKCDKYVCDSPGCLAGCSSFERFIDHMQNRLERGEPIDGLIQL